MPQQDIVQDIVLRSPFYGAYTHTFDSPGEWKTLWVSDAVNMLQLEALLNDGWIVVSEISMPKGCIFVMFHSEDKRLKKNCE